MDNDTALPEFERYLQRRYPERSTAKHYLSDITSVTGLAILRAIVAGERNPVKLAQFRNPTCKSSEDDIAKALTGSWRAEHLFVLKQALELFDFYTQQAAACDAETGFILQAEVVGEAAQATIELVTLLSFHKRENYRECDPIDPDSEDTL